MAPPTASYFDDGKTNGVSDRAPPNLSIPTISILAPSLSTAVTRELSSATGTLYHTTPATTSNGDMSAGSGSNRPADREERAVAALLGQFKTLVKLAAEPVQDGVTKEMAATRGLQMEVEGSALVRATEDLLQLSRELKELWLFGPLRDIKEGEGEGQMDIDSQKVGELAEVALKRAAEHPPSR